MHFEKAAGTTIHGLLGRTFTDSEIFPEKSEAIRYWPKPLLGTYKFFSVHASVRDIAHIPPPFRAITFLRDPIDRVISLYRYWCSFRDEIITPTNLILPRYAKSLSFEGFISEQSVRELPSLWNSYTQRLAGDQFFAPNGRLWRSEAELVTAALDNLERFAFVGIVEDMAVSVDRMARVLELELDYGGERENDTEQNHLLDPVTFDKPARLTLGARACERLLEITRLDRIIYDYAVKRLGYRLSPERRYNLIPHRDARAFEEGCRRWVRASSSDGHSLYGPSVPLAPGRYQADFLIRLDRQVPATEEIATLDVAIRCGEVISSRKVHAGDCRDPKISNSLQFVLDRLAGDAEFRVAMRPNLGASARQDVIVRRL